MRIEILQSAHRHDIEDTEIRTVVEFPKIRVRVPRRRPGAVLVLYIGPAAENQPWIEVVADHQDGAVIVFHAMMLRPEQFFAAQLDDKVVTPDYGPQRR